MKSATRRSFTLGAAAACMAAPASASGAAEAAEPYPYAHVGGAAQAFRAPKFGGGVAQLSDYRDKTLVLAFGGLWCGDCVVEEQELNQLAHLVLARRDMGFLALHSFDRYGRWGERGATLAAGTAAITAYRQEMNTEYPLAFDFDGAIAHAYDMEWFPTILIIDGHGVVRGDTTDLRAHKVARFFAEAEAIARQR